MLARAAKEIAATDSMAAASKNKAETGAPSDKSGAMLEEAADSIARPRGEADATVSPPDKKSADDGSAFVVELPQDGDTIAYRKSANMEDRDTAVAANGTRVWAVQQTEEWVQIEEGRWLPKRFLRPAAKPKAPNSDIYPAY